MKKVLSIFAVLISIFIFSGMALAGDVGELPTGTSVCAVCNGDNTATVKITGVSVKNYAMFSYYQDTQNLGAVNEVKHNLDKSRRFNFTFDKGWAGLDGAIKKGSAYGGASFLGDNIDIDDRDPHNPNKINPNGACFVITCPTVKAKK